METLRKSEGIGRFNGKTVYKVDGLETLITSVRGTIAKGQVLRKDFTTSPCYIVKMGAHFAHGDTLIEAQASCTEKVMQDMSVEERIELFFGEFTKGKKYPAQKFFEWHNTLTGSCIFGRRQFAEEHNIDLSKDQFTVEEFIELCENDYGSDIIKRLRDE